jgi:high-affinity iron transporter
MIESFLVTSRETLEASLVIGIVLAYLNKSNNQNYKKSVYYGIFFGILASVLAAFLFTMFAGGFKGSAEALFEGITMLIGAFLLTTMILWMMQQRRISKEIEDKVQKHLMSIKPMFSHIGIFMIIFTAILREGVETVIFLNAINYANGINFLGGTLGIIAAMIIGYLFFISTRKINLKKLFNISSILLILFAAGLIAHGVHELQEASVIPYAVKEVWNTNSILSENGLIGSFAKGLFGYNGNPSLIEVMSYLSYLVLIYIFYKRMQSSKVKLSI